MMKQTITSGLACFLTLFALLSLFPQASALSPREFTFQYIDVSSGLSNNYVSKIITDDHGIKWFACEGGINTYDGINFNIIRPNERYSALKNENIETLFKDSQGKIWVGTKSGGISCYDPVLDEFKNYNHLIRKDGREVSLIRVTAITEDDEGHIWVATWGEGLHVFYLAEDTAKAFLPGRIVNDLTVDVHGNIWAVSNQAIHKYDPSEKRLIDIPVAVGATMAVYYDQRGERLLIGSSKGLFEFNPDRYQLREFEASKTGNFTGINTISLDRKGRIWVGSWRQGLYVSSADETVFEKLSLLPPYFNNSNYETVLDIMIDDREMIWVATAHGGVVRIDQRNKVRHTANTFESDIGLPDNNIKSIIKDTEGNLWCGTWGGGIGYSVDGESFIQLPGTGNKQVSSFHQIGSLMLVGTKDGIFMYDLSDPMSGPVIQALKGIKIKDIYLDRRNRLWIGAQQTGLWLYDYSDDPELKSPVRFVPDPRSSTALNSERVSTISEDVKGNLWIGTYNGLYRFEESDSSFVRSDQSGKTPFPSVIMLSLYALDADTLWVGVPGGLLKVLNNNGNLELLKTFDAGTGLKNDYVTAVTMDQKGNIWMSNAAGIATLRREEEVVINLEEDEDHPYLMNIDAYYNDGDWIYFGSSNGLFDFDPLKVEITFQPPEIVFTELRINNKPVMVGEEVNGHILLDKSVGYTQKIHLTHKESVVSLFFVATDYLGEKNLNYLYRIKGLHSDWINNGKNGEISFIGPNEGTYMLEVKSTRDMLNFGEVKQMELVIAPPPWFSNTAFFIYTLLLGLVALLIRQVSINRTRLKARLELEQMSKRKDHELNEAKLVFFTNISHELRTPLTLILSPLSEILSDSGVQSGIKEKLNYIDTNARRLLHLINQLLDFRKADQGMLKLQVANGNFVPFAREIYLSFKGHAEAEKMAYAFNTSTEQIPLTFDRDKMEIVLANLLSNAFKFSPKGGKVTLSLSVREDFCLVSVKDTGKGISRENRVKIFDRFFQIKDTTSLKVIGSGIGLSLSQKIAQLHRGDIEVRSKEGKGSEFIVKIPLGDAHFSADDFVCDFKDSNDKQHYPMTLPVNGQSHNGKGETLLIIDDNPDIRKYLKSLLQDNYQVLTAENGVEGRQIAEQVIPDLIISDVMMPEMDGLELCKLLKSQIATSHIPIILLTARTSTVYEVDGLNTGADDYVKKPFDASVVRSRVASQLENRKKVREHLLNKVRFEPSPTIKSTNFEEKFIEEAVRLVEEHIDDESFGVETLADILCMSQSTLYRKIKSLTGMSIAGFIRSVRLKKASELLLTENLNMSSIAYKVGFSDYNYFKKSFISQFGKSPREFIDKRKQ